MQRYDAGQVTSVERAPAGGVIVNARFTKSGIFKYRLPDGSTRREFRPSQEVHHADSVATYAHAPVTDDHPPDGVDPANWKQVAIGHVAGAKASPPYVEGSLVLAHGDSIEKALSGKLKEISCGYDCDYDPTPGSYQGEPYDGTQSKIRINHVALGGEGWGRAGRDVRLRLDGGGAVQVEIEPMAIERIDGIDYEIGSTSYQQARTRFDAQRTDRIVQLEAENKAEKARADKAEATGKAQQERADKVEAALKTATDPTAFAARVKARSKLVKDCALVAREHEVKFDADDPKVEGSSDQDMMVGLMKEIDPSFDPEGKSPDFIQGAFYALVRAALKGGAADPDDADEGLDTYDTLDPMSPPPAKAKRGDSVHRARQGNEREDREDVTDPADSYAAEERMRKRNQDAWKAVNK